MADRHRLSSSARTMLAMVAPALAVLVGACSGDDKVSTADDASSTIIVPTTFGLPTSTIAATTTSATTQTTATTTTTPPPTTVADTTTSAPPTTVAPTAPADTTSAPACPNASEPPPTVDPSHQIVGNIDGDGVDDTVTAYMGADGVPHVHLQRGGAEASDVSLSFDSVDPVTSSTVANPATSKSVSISFEDFDHSATAASPSPLVVMAIGVGPAGAAPVTFLSAVPTGDGGGICLTQWTHAGQPFIFTIDHRGPFSGLLCDHAAGRTYYVLRTATPIDPATTTTTAPPTTVAAPSSTGPAVTVAFTTTATQIDHDGATVTLTELGGDNIPDDASMKDKYGDILGCDHPPLFP